MWNENKNEIYKHNHPRKKYKTTELVPNVNKQYGDVV